MHPERPQQAPAADLDALTAAVARLEGTADALDARLEAAGRPAGQGA